MFKKLFFVLFSCVPLVVFGQGQMTQANGIAIWYETFGEKDNPPLLLIMGGCCQGVMWPQELCERMADAGFYVIRYDHRDMGLSTCCNYENEPYVLMDLANDAVGLMDAIGVEKAHLFGLSMGGFISQIIAAKYPERVQTITVMGSSCDVRPMNLGLAGLPPEEGAAVSPPTDLYVVKTNEVLQLSAKTEEEKLAQRVDVWNMLNGDGTPLDESMNRQIQKEFLARCTYPEGIANHIRMIRDERSEALIRFTSWNVQVPTIILQGSEDPIFPPDHGEALHRLIDGSEYYLVEGMGHVPNDHFFDLYIDVLKRQASLFN